MKRVLSLSPLFLSRSLSSPSVRCYLLALARSTFTSCACCFFFFISSIFLCWRMLRELYSALSSPRQSSSSLVSNIHKRTHTRTHTHIYIYISSTIRKRPTDGEKEKNERKVKDYVCVLPGPSLSIHPSISFSLFASYTTRGAVVVVVDVDVAPKETYLLSSRYCFGVFLLLFLLLRLSLSLCFSFFIDTSVTISRSF